MPDTLRVRLTYANVVSTVSLFVVLGGTSYAVATGSIDSRALKDDAIRSRTFPTAPCASAISRQDRSPAPRGPEDPEGRRESRTQPAQQT